MSCPDSPSIALVTARAARDLDEDMPPLQSALRDAGARVCIADWDDLECDWAAFDLAVVRSTWDYVSRLSQFLSWAERVSLLTSLLNPPSLMRWNIDKHYLADLTRAGVATVASEFIEPGDRADERIAEFLRRHSAAELVVKPAIGAGSRDAQRHARGDGAAIEAHVARLLQDERSVLLQPYLEHVDEHGETALIYVEGQFSHAVRKDALLRRGEESTRGLFAPERITPRAAAADEQRLAERVLSAIPCGTPLYARIDLIRDASGAPCVLELELTEPSLFFAQAPQSAPLFATAILRRAARRARRACPT